MRKILLIEESEVAKFRVLSNYLKDATSFKVVVMIHHRENKFLIAASFSPTNGVTNEPAIKNVRGGRS